MFPFRRAKRLNITHLKNVFSPLKLNKLVTEHMRIINNVQLFTYKTLFERKELVD